MPNWKDISPRLGAAYDLFGNGKTAIKASLGRYVVYETTQHHHRHQPRPGHRRIDHADLERHQRQLRARLQSEGRAPNGECGPMADRRFGTPIVTTHYATM